MKTKILQTMLLIFISNVLFSQTGVSINNSGLPADLSAQLDISSADKGVLIPRLTTAQKNAITNPADGLIIYQTDSVTGIYYYDVNKWVLTGSNAGDNLGNHTASQSLDMNNNTVTNVASPVNLTDAANAGDIQAGSLIFATSTGSSNNYLISLSPSPSTYTTGMTVNFKAAFENTGAISVNVNGLGNIPVKKNFNIDIEAGDIKLNQVVSIMYDGTNFQMLSQLGKVSGGLTSEVFSPSTCVSPAKTSVTWGDFYPAAAASGYELKNCYARSYYGSDPSGWITLGMSTSGCSGGSSAGNKYPTSSSTWSTVMHTNAQNMYWFAVYGRVAEIVCFK